MKKQYKIFKCEDNLEACLQCPLNKCHLGERGGWGMIGEERVRVIVREEEDREANNQRHKEYYAKNKEAIKAKRKANRRSENG